MNDTRTLPDWNPASATVGRDQLAAYDDMRERCPVAYSEALGWSLFRHADIARVLEDPETFSNAVSRHLSVPNGMDPPEHAEYRRIIEPYFSPERMTAFEPVCRRIAAGLVRNLFTDGEIELMERFAQPFAVRVQCAFLDWPADLHEPLRHWILGNQAATRAQDRAELAKMAGEFEAHVRGLLEERRRSADAEKRGDITSDLLLARVRGRPLRDEEIVSILRNWTAGEVGTISAAVGILAQFLAEHGELQQQLRDDPAAQPAAIEEILRLHGPLVSNRRVTTRAVELGGRSIEAGERLTLNWIAANRDGRVFEAPGEFRLDRDQTPNLLYGAGIHVCPGAPLARLELRVVLEELLARTRHIEPDPERSPERAQYPASGFAVLPLRIH